MSLAREAAQQRIDILNAEFDLFVAQQGEKARTLEQELALEETLAEKRKEILKKELANKFISQAEYQTALQELENEQAQKKAEIAVKNAETELEIYRQGLEKKYEDEQYLSERLAEQRKLDNDLLLAQEEQFAQIQLEQGIINQDEFDAAIREVQEANRVANKEIDKEREQIEKDEANEQALLDAQDSLLTLREQKASEFEIQREALETQLEADKLAIQQEIGNEELKQQRIAQLDREAALAKEQIRQAETQAFLDNGTTIP